MDLVQPPRSRESEVANSILPKWLSLRQAASNCNEILFSFAYRTHTPCGSWKNSFVHMPKGIITMTRTRTKAAALWQRILLHFTIGLATRPRVNWTRAPETRDPRLRDSLHMWVHIVGPWPKAVGRCRQLALVVTHPGRIVFIFA